MPLEECTTERLFVGHRRYPKDGAPAAADGWQSQLRVFGDQGPQVREVAAAAAGDGVSKRSAGGEQLGRCERHRSRHREVGVGHVVETVERRRDEVVRPAHRDPRQLELWQPEALGKPPERAAEAVAHLGEAGFLTGTPGERPFESSIVALDATGNAMAEVEIPDLGDRFMAWGSASGPAFVVERDAVGTMQPDRSLIATTDGETWLVQELDELPMPTLVAINGTTVLVGAFAWEAGGADVWQRFEMTG